MNESPQEKVSSPENMERRKVFLNSLQTLVVAATEVSGIEAGKGLIEDAEKLDKNSESYNADMTAFLKDNRELLREVAGVVQDRFSAIEKMADRANVAFGAFTAWESILQKGSFDMVTEKVAAMDEIANTLLNLGETAKKNQSALEEFKKDEERLAEAERVLLEAQEQLSKLTGR